MHAPNELNNTSNYWGNANIPDVYAFPTDSVVVVHHIGQVSSNIDWGANAFPAFVLHGSSSPFHSALLFGNNGKIQLRRTRYSSIGLELSTFWTDEGGNLNNEGGYISFRPRSTSPDDDGHYPPGPEAMRIVPGGLIGIGTSSPTEQLHTTKGVRFEGLDSNESLSSFLVRDDAGKIYFRNVDLDQYITSSCATPSVVPLFSGYGSGDLVCSIIEQAKTEGCSGFSHWSIGINGDPIGVGYSGSFGECHDVYLTVHGSALATDGLWIASDMRIKKNTERIDPMTGMEKVRHLNPVSFSYDKQSASALGLNGISDHRSSGFIAQEVGVIVPEAVSTTESGLHILNPDILIPYLTAALQYQDEVIKRLDERIALLEEKIALYDLHDSREKINRNSSDDDVADLLKVAPNPVERGGKVYVYYVLPGNETINRELFALKIFSLSGELLHSYNIAEKSGNLTFTCDFSDPGFVVVLFKNDFPIASQKIIVIN